jgi:hypothetical protein
MYAVIRTYDDPEIAGQLAAKQDDVQRLVSGVDGFRSYHLVQTESGCTSISVFEDRAGADESTRVAGEWIQQQSDDINQVKPTVTAGEVLIDF